MSKQWKSVDRDVSWMYFNRRILEQATRVGVPPLERLTFLGIYSNNLDEFFRVRVASLRRMALATHNGEKARAAYARTLLRKISALNAEYVRDYQAAVTAAWERLRQEGISVVRDDELTQEQADFIHDFFRRKLSGRVVPLWTDQVQSFEKEGDDTIYLMTRILTESKKPLYAVIPVPVEVTGRWVELPDSGQKRCVMYIDDVLRACMPQLFPGIPICETVAYSFKFTRDAEMDIQDDPTAGLMQKVSSGVKKRKAGTPLRLVYDGEMPKGMLRRITRRLDGGRLDTAVAGGRYQNHRDLMKFPDFGRSDLKYPRWPAVRPAWIDTPGSIFDSIREKDRFLHVPYHSFDGYIRLLDEAAVNPAVKSIKTTLYRLAKDSKVVKALMAAAQNGKKVTVVIELLARFDESANISWSKKMQDAGVEVLFGPEGLKVHSKLTLITFRKGSSIACISTGNFHEGNAAAYTDMLLMTARRNITADVERVFKFIRRPYEPVKFRELLVSPNDMKPQFLSLIKNEIKNHLAGKPAYIKCKVNHITDPMMVETLYEATHAGVPVELAVRGNCALTDQTALDGNMRVSGIIGRYLEHSRIFRFCNGGDEKVFIGSADWMPRNLDCRIEVVTPVYDPDIKAECQRIVDYGLHDTAEGRPVVGAIEPEYGPEFSSQEKLYQYYSNGNN